MRLTPEQFLTYFEWLVQVDKGGLIGGFKLALVLCILGFLIGYVVSLVKHGPGEGFLQTARVIRELFMVDLPGMSFRRIGAIAQLAIKEAIRKKVLVVVAAFVVAMMFAGWFLDPKAENPARLYIAFVLSTTNFMIMLLGLFISCFSLPNDIKSRTIYTIVTKPVRPTELFLGRVFGFVAVGSAIVFLLGALSYVFVTRGLSHTHSVDSYSQDGLSGVTSLQQAHRHNFKIQNDQIGEGLTDEVKGHRHIVRKSGDKYVVEEQFGDLGARVPIYAKSLQFADRDGSANKGFNVGYMSEYHKYIEGDTLSSATWSFRGVPVASLGDVINFELTISAFRTYKGDIVTPVGGIMIFRNPDPKVAIESDRRTFKVKEFQVDRHTIPRKIKGFKNGEPVDLDFFTDIAPDGNFDVEIRCQDHGQYLGMAAADLYINAAEYSFGWNFFKGYVSIWLQMVIVICFGVMFSSFLSGPVAIIATLSTLSLGFFGFFIDDIIAGTLGGGGPIESLIRIPLQSGSAVDLDLGSPALEQSIKFLDRGLLALVQSCKDALPDFGALGTADFVAYGVNLFGGLLCRHLTIAAGYFLMTSIVSYFFLKTREMAA